MGYKMEQNNENKLTLEDFIKLANKVKEWQRVPLTDYAFDGRMDITHYCNFWQGSIYSGNLKIGETSLDISVYEYSGGYRDESGKYGLFISTNDPFIIKKHNVKTAFYVHQDHFIYEELFTTNSNVPNVNALEIQKVYFKAEEFVENLEKKILQEKEDIEIQKINETTDMIKSYVIESSDHLGKSSDYLITRQNNGKS
ncbi:MAG: hypothetical protein ACP5N1_04145 [Candidatus Woesearchaeota archaeon]